ncbi:MAG TPA: hypothetical protein VF549_08750 [Solirubrobacteraceae bacterium]|jgi:hypothetical protein
MASVEETLAWEAEWRPRAVAAALVAALAGTAGGVMLALLEHRGPAEEDGFVSLPEALGVTAAGREPGEPSLLVRLIDYRGDKLGLFILSAVLTILGAVGALMALTYLFRAARARNPEIGRAVGWSIAAALALYPLGRGLREIATSIEYSQFADAAERTPGAVRDIPSEGVLPAAALIEILGQFALALAFVLVSLNAMRVGLLTRFMGILGVIVGALTVFQLDAPQVVRGLWLAFLGALVAGRYPGGTPPAWLTGRAEPWPTQQELRERRDALRAEHREDAEADTDEDTVAVPAQAPRPGDPDYVPGAARRKRKKRK